MTANLIYAIILGYFLGSIPFSHLIAKYVKGVDLSKVGSFNVGGRNLTRNLGLAWGLTGGLLDALKGFSALYIATTIFSLSAPTAYFAAYAAVAGHNWPIWLKFRGGKGLATAGGAVLQAAPAVALISTGIAVLVLLLTKNILLTALTAFISMFAVISLYGYAQYINTLVLGTFVVVLAASLPDILHKLRTSGGVKEYMRDPNKVYDIDAAKNKKS
jgi:glycerol-3-phosphate acyltransferase PlsY